MHSGLPKRQRERMIVILQLRSADEGSTVFYTVNICFTVWWGVASHEICSVYHANTDGA